MSVFLLVLLVVVLLLIPTTYAGYIGAPFVPSRKRIIRKAFAMFNVGPQDTLVDLGAGDGGVLIEAAKRGAKAYGYELSPIMWLIAWLRLKFLPLSKGEREGVKKHPRVSLANFYKQDISDATIVFAFLVPDTMPRLKKYLATQTTPQGKILMSFAFPFKDVNPIQVIREDKSSSIYVYDLHELTKQ